MNFGPLAMDFGPLATDFCPLAMDFGPEALTFNMSHPHKLCNKILNTIPFMNIPNTNKNQNCSKLSYLYKHNS